MNENMIPDDDDNKKTHHWFWAKNEYNDQIKSMKNEHDLKKSNNSTIKWMCLVQIEIKADG